MFEGNSQLKSLDLSNWDISNVANVGCMFAKCSQLKSLDLSNWNTFSVDYMGNMFFECVNLEYLNISSWTTTSLEKDYIFNIFNKCDSLYSLEYNSLCENIILELSSQRKWYQNDQGPYNASKIPTLPQGAQAILTREDHFDKSNLFTDTSSSGEMYRLYNSNSGEHFYTGNPNEKNQLSSMGWKYEWKYEGVAWYAPQSSNTPVYRLYNKNSSDHHYTTDQNERDTLVRSGWKDEGIGWYSDDKKGVPLYRVYNPKAQAGSHHYTTDKTERDYLVGIGWNNEGIAWYGLK